MNLTLTILGRPLLALEITRGQPDQPDQPAPRQPAGFTAGQTLRLDHPPQRAGQRAGVRPARADQEDRDV